MKDETCSVRSKNWSAAALFTGFGAIDNCWSFRAVMLERLPGTLARIGQQRKGLCGLFGALTGDSALGTICGYALGRAPTLDLYVSDLIYLGGLPSTCAGNVNGVVYVVYDSGAHEIGDVYCSALPGAGLVYSRGQR